ncbi:MAG: type II secretion system F family protein [Planctomycetes bacterium]|jgi:general secretion pathway protein F|nr:type II secretion system F family protein [Planctomycetota bacterium]
MALFEYTQVNNTGRESRGVVDAPSLGEARRRLRAAGLHIRDLVERPSETQSEATPRRWRTGRISVRDLSTATRQLSVILLAGMPLVGALSALVQQLGDNRLGRIFAQVRDRVNEGAALAQALADHPSVFPPVYVSMVEAAEAAGTLENVLTQLADLFERRAKLMNKVKSALAYPIFMVVVGSCVVVFILSFVLPSVTKLFLEMKMRLPWPTIVLIQTSDVAARYLWVFVIGLVGLAAAGVYAVRTPAGRKFWDRFQLRCPLFGDVMLKVTLSRFSRTLGVLLASGVTIVEALRLSEHVAGNVMIRQAAADAREAVSHGATIAESLGQSGYFPPLVVSMIAIGEQSGTVEDGLARIADLLEGDVEARLGTLTSLLEPLLILVLGVIVGFIVLAMLLPIFEINQAIA